MTMSASYRAPFAPGGPAGIDDVICQRLLSVALARGGDYADLFFEYRAGGALVFDEGILKSASRGVSMGLGVRVQRGDATGYAYVEDLTWEAMRRAAETASQIASGGGGGRTLAYFDEKGPEWHAAEAARQAITMLDAREAPAGQFEVVLAPGDSGILLHEAVGHGLEADFNRKGTSNYTGKVGQPVASELCTVVDDATLLQSRGTINIDDEGNEPARSVLIEEGVLKGYMHDRLRAKHF